jgi:AcrR family transcriptional regulator
MDTKARIVREALRLFLDRGYDRASVSDVARAVGITKPAIYHHFGSKDEILQAVLSLFFDEMGRWSEERLRSRRTLRELLEAIFGSIGVFQQVADVLLGEPQGETPYSVLELFLAASKWDPSFRKRLGEGFVGTRAALADKLREAQGRGEIRADIDCETLAFEIHALIEGTGLIAYIDKSIDMDAIGRAMFESMWRLIEGRDRPRGVPAAQARGET